MKQMNDFRKSIIPGTEIKLGEKTYLIESVYDYTDDFFIYLATFKNEHYLIKEYYPLVLSEELERRATSLIASNQTLFNNAKKEYLQKSQELENIVRPLDISNWQVDFEPPTIIANETYNTVYTIINFENTWRYEDYHENNLTTLIDNFLALAHLTTSLHNSGYIIHNLNPHNLLIQQVNGHSFMRILDDACLSKDYQFGISNGEYLAPEALTQESHQCSELIDNYALGLMFKERLAKLNYENVHYRLKDLLEELISHTVCPLEERFSDEKILVGLLKCRDFASLAQPLTTKVFNKHNFYGHQDEYQALTKLLEHQKSGFISGPAGSGKRALAYQYADKHRDKYANIIFVDYQTSWLNTFKHLYFDQQIPNDLSLEKLLFEMTIALDGSLLIVDNYIYQENDLWLNYLTHLNLTLIITTCDSIESAIYLKPLNPQDSFELFNNCYAKPLTEAEIDHVQTLLTYTMGNPGLIKLVAKTLKYRHRALIGSNIFYYLNELRKKEPLDDLMLAHGQIIFKMKKFNHQTIKLLKLLYFFKDIHFKLDDLNALGFKQQLLITLSYENILIKHHYDYSLNPVIEHYFDDLKAQQKLSLDEHLTASLIALNTPDSKLAILRHIDAHNPLYQDLCSERNFVKGDLKLIALLDDHPYSELCQKRLTKQMELNRVLIQNAQQFQKIFKHLERLKMEKEYAQAIKAYENQAYEEAIAHLNKISYALIFEYYNDQAVVQNFYRIAEIYTKINDFKHALLYLDEIFALCTANQTLTVEPQWVELLENIKAKLAI